MHHQIPSNNATTYTNDIMNIIISLPDSGLIASAQRATPAAAPTRDLAGTINRYYATFTDGSSCSSKSSTKFDAWETYYTTLDECCDMEFSWDYDNCILSLQN